MVYTYRQKDERTDIHPHYNVSFGIETSEPRLNAAKPNEEKYYVLQPLWLFKIVGRAVLSSSQADKVSTQKEIMNQNQTLISFIYLLNNHYKMKKENKKVKTN